MAYYIGISPQKITVGSTQYIGAPAEEINYTAADILSKLITVDGTGSGLDADLLDGQSIAYFATAAQGALADTAVQPGELSTVESDLTTLINTKAAEVNASAIAYAIALG